ncbi:MYXO-CTERM sorting domain-containing protein [Nodularia spumigena]|uniref:MYXO-CTERM sorting domain-containing protein n=1 Tax=Nodularia spumigena TaxID=70799 RepID=UPI002B1F5DFF|nr:MYXO-CTERM sorting domain-containing protein [Nodularia spumigena]MEA5556261.1 MYXO-CTERM sorting domain-containing protein [Nodularia spumigena CH309]
MKNAIALFAVAGLAGFASAAGTVVVNMVPQAASINIGESVTFDVFVDYSGVTGGLAIAGWKFDVTHSSNGSATGLVNNAVFNQGVVNGADNSAGSLIGFAGGQLPPAFGGGNPTQFIGSITYTDGASAAANYAVSLDLTNFVGPTGALNIFNTATGGQSRSSLTSTTGNFHAVVVNSGSVDVIIPSPASLALLGLGGLVAGRRRR